MLCHRPLSNSRCFVYLVYLSFLICDFTSDSTDLPGHDKLFESLKKTGDLCGLKNRSSGLKKAQNLKTPEDGLEKSPAIGSAYSRRKYY